ncbi:MAG: hypothetical protein E6R04_08210 [Spirochaetes bacterium]|nr:MAG: hypothetical protein E6R04_08210 [Spirochaetota bacterium]
MSDKPIREWWICLKKMEYAGFYYAEDKEKQPDLYPHYCHVIEAAPMLAKVERLEAENSELKAKIEASYYLYPEKCKIITRLRAQLEKCKWQRNCCGGLYKDDIAFYDAEIESIK